MPDPLTISNTSPLLYLHLVRRLDLLRDLYGEVFLPPAVIEELQAGAEQGVDVPQIMNTPWLKVMKLISDTSIPLVIDLGRGEAEVIALGLENPESRLLLDDTLARRIARLHKLRFTGTVGVVIKAKQAGLISKVSPLITNLLDAGLWLHDSFIAEVLHQAGED
jgi:predicted nucleic acid-binding protein